MKQVLPYSSQAEAMQALDNGGHFYHLFSKADDGEISMQELKSVAGSFSSKQQLSVYLDMALMELGEAEKGKIQETLSDELFLAYQSFRPAHFRPSEAVEKGRASQCAVITGIPRKVDAKSEFKGFIMIPIMAGSVMVMSMIPIIDQYDVYQIHDELSQETFLVAHTRGKGKLPESKVRCGGMLKQLKSNESLDESQNNTAGLYLETFYFSEC